MASSSPPALPEIRQLPPSVVNKIAAGEVIERPASVVKELMENAVDAGATRIEVSLEQGGQQLIRVADNGCGMSPDQFALALSSHATSKIRDADDLFSVATLGFRGEALASIAEISELRLRSRPHDAEAGAQLEVTGGAAQPLQPCGCAPGTSVEVRSLFYNTPVRRKFMRTTQTEMGHAAEAFARIVLPRPDVHFVLRHNERLVHDLPPVDNWKDRLASLFGGELAGRLIWVEGEFETLRLSGYVADPQLSRANNRMQYLFLNGRHIRDRALQHALGEAYRGLLLTGRQPIAFLRLTLDPQLVDVNVHPTKLEVRFQDSGRIYSALLGSIRGRFLSQDLTATVGAAPAQQGSSGQSPAPQQPAPQQQPDDPRQSLQWARQSPLPLPTPPLSSRAAEVLQSLTQASSDTSGGGPAQGESAFHVPASEPSAAAGGSPPAGGLGGSAHPAPRVGMQIHNRYLVTETEEGMMVIDQHALHERILYEHLRAKALAGDLEIQRLLVPEPVSLAPAEAAAVLDAADELARLGMQIEPFGGDTVLVSTHPAMLSKPRPGEMLRHVAQRLTEDGSRVQRRDLLDDLLNMMSCKAAVKAGDPLSPEEVAALLEQRVACQDSHHCPHGRPTTLVFTPQELDRRFHRT